jgi:LysM repeat protein
MSFRIQLLLISVLLTLGIGPVASYAQPDDDTCPVIVQTALDTVDRFCSDTQRNIACYGNLLIDATPRPDVVNFTFEQPGDIVDVVNVESLQLENMDLVNQTWGIAVLKLQANLPDTLPGQNVTFLLFGDVTVTNAVDPEDTTQTPMQAFYLSTGIGDRRCNEAPDSGILIQTPEGVETVDLNINGVDIALGSTAFLQSSTEHMDLFLLEHEAEAGVGDDTQIVPAGTFVRIPLDEDGLASGPPGYPEPYDLDSLESLPTSHLPREVEVPPPLTKEEIDEALGQVATPALIYTVQAGDTMYSIARCFRTTYPIIAEANDIADPSVIYAGQELIVPTDAGTVPAQRTNWHCPQARPATAEATAEADVTTDEAPICELNWCYEDGPWGDGRCTEDWHWEAGWFRACYEAGLIEAVPSSIVDPPVPGQQVQVPQPQPFQASIACVTTGQVQISYSRVMPGDELTYNVPGCDAEGSVIAPRTSGVINLFYCYKTGTGWIQNPSGYVVPLADIGC